MKAILYSQVYQSNLMCECLNMMYRGKDNYLVCLNERCEHFQKKYDAPIYVELTAVDKKDG